MAACDPPFEAGGNVNRNQERQVSAMDEKQVTPEEAEELRGKAVQATVERDVAVRVAAQAIGKETEAQEAAMEQRDVALSAQAETVRASGREAVAKQDAREQREEVLIAQAETVKASGREAVAREDAREQQAEALIAQASAVRASGREAEATAVAQEQHAEAVSAQTEAAHMTTLRHLANERADSEATSGDRARFMLLLLGGIMVAALIGLMVWLWIR